MSVAPTVTLNSGAQMPHLGLGTWPMNDDETATAVAGALGQGYRLVDTAENYENEGGVGEGIRRSGVGRADVFVTSKFNRKWHSVDGVRRACEMSLDRLGLDYLDLFLVHWPNPDQDTYLDAVEGLLEVVEAGLVRSWGTSNFKPAHLARLFAAGHVPAVNQIQLDPFHTRDDLVALHNEHGIRTETWSPIGRPSGSPDDVVAAAPVRALAEKYGRTPGQIVLRWHVQQGFIPTPKSADPGRQAENLAVFDFELSDAELQSLHLDRPQYGSEFLDADEFGH